MRNYQPRFWRSALRTCGRVVLIALLLATAVTPAFATQPVPGQPEVRLAPLEQAQRAAGKRHGRRQTVTRPFANDGVVTIPAVGAVSNFSPASPYPSAIQVSGLKNAKITDVDLTLRGFFHVDAEDVDMLLVAPNGSNAAIFSDVGGLHGSSELTLTLDDDAANPLPLDPPVVGRFRPSNLDFGAGDDVFPDAPTPSGGSTLSTFDGGDPNGAWRLFVVDDTGGNRGALVGGWSLTITAKVKKHKGQHEHQRRH